MASKQYLNGRDLYKEIIISKEMGKLTPQAQRMLYLLGKNIIKKFSYSNPMDREDCLQEGMLQLYKNWMLFDEHKSENTFAYYTEVFKRGVAQSFNRNYQKKGDEYMSKRLISMSGWGEEGIDMNI
jgi:DNA-directed RNA polymerase specialized sigma subunit